MRAFRKPFVMGQHLVLLLCAVIFSFCCFSAGAQDYRASVTGSIADPSGATVAGAKVTLHNQATGVDTTTKSDGAGDYVLNYIDPGTYLLSVDAAGFQHWEMRDLRLDTAQEVKVNVSLKLSNTASNVTVVSGGTLLETANADVTQLFDSKDISELPIADGNPTMLLQTIGGSVWTGNPIYSRVFDNGAVTSFRVNGVVGASMFYLNGVPDNGVDSSYSAQSMAFMPPVDAVSQVRVSSSWYNATDGMSAAANVNFNTKSGGNTPHGSLYEYLENEALNSSTWLANHLDEARPEQRSNHFGGTIGGPVWIPHFYDGRNKTFFFFLSDNVLDYFPEPTTFVVPTAAMRKGDLSAICTAGFNSDGVCNDLNQQVYNPFSATATTGGHVTRQPFPNNQIPSNLINPITAKILSYYPQPNIPGVSADGSPNYYSPDAQTDTYHALLLRLDHYIGSNQHLAGDYFWSHRVNGIDRWTGVVNGLNPAASFYEIFNHGFGITDTVTLSPTTVLDARIGFNRYEQATYPGTLGLDLSSLGFPSSVISQFNGQSYLPPFASSDMATLNSETISARPGNEYSWAAALTRSIGSHLLKFGYEGMLYRINSIAPGDNLGTYTFDGNYATQTDSSATEFGTGMTDFLVGQPTSGSISVNASYAEQIPYHSAFIQDEWKITPKVTITAGLRYEFEGAPTERYNRNTRGFDLTSANPVQAGAAAAWAADFPSGLNVGSGLPVKTNFSALGGYTWADSQHRGFFDPDYKVFMPRLGLAYAVLNGTVLRGGVGIYKSPWVTELNGYPGGNQTGFSQTTTLVPTTNNGLTFVANIDNPFPNGVAAPTGSSLGLYQNLGQSASFFPLKPPTEYAAHWTAEVQQSLPAKWVLDLLYLGSKGWHMTNTSNLPDAVPQAYFSTMQTRDTTLIDELTKSVPNPFKGLMGPTSVNSTALNTGKTTTVYQLLRPMPQFTAVSETVFNYSFNYQSLQVRIARRFSKGYSFNAIYTRSKAIQRYGFNNDFQVLPNRSLSGDDFPNRLTATFVAELPFGRGRTWLHSLPGWEDAILGGWQASGIYQGQSGAPVDFGNVYFSGDPYKLHFHYKNSLVGTGTPMIDTSGFYIPTAPGGGPWSSPAAMRADSRISLEYNIPYFPYNMGNTRTPVQDNIDLGVKKKFRASDRVSFETAATFLNAFNHPWWTNPYTTPSQATFGTLDGNQKNTPRYIELNGRVTF